MKTKIEEAQELRRRYENNKKSVQYCLGKQEDGNGGFVYNPNNDKHKFLFSVSQHHSSKPIFLDAYYGYYGNSNVSMFNDDFYVECLTESINNHLAELREEAEKIMKERCDKALFEAKDEAEYILRMVDELGMNEENAAKYR